MIFENLDFEYNYGDNEIVILNSVNEKIGEMVISVFKDRESKNGNKYSGLEGYMDEQSSESFPFKYYDMLNDVSYGRKFPVSNFVILDRLEIKEQLRGIGLGDLVLKDFASCCKDADIECILLFPYPLKLRNENGQFFTTEEEYIKVLNFYKRNGFQEIFNEGLADEYTGSKKRPYCYLRIE